MFSTRDEALNKRRSNGGSDPDSRSPHSTRSRLATVKINGIDYRVNQQLSLLRRGRWQIWERRPPPQGTVYTLIEIDESPASQQLLESLRRLPSSARSLPQLRDWHLGDGKLQMVVTWCPGITLDSYLQKVVSQPNYQPIGAYEALRRMRWLAEACCVLHRDCRIIHGDLKPANLILPSSREPISLIDFGSSWQIESTYDRVEGDGCDPYYSAPELFENQRTIDGRSDQFSIGVMLFQMMTGNLPYENLGGLAGHKEHRGQWNGPVESVIELAPKVVGCLPEPLPKEIDQVVRRALSLDPKGRYSTMRSFADELERLFQQIKAARRTHKTKVSPEIPTKKPWWQFW
jgi:serine/threonine protein kinase